MLHGVEADEAGLFGAAGEAAALPDLAVSQHRQRFVDYGVAVADAVRGALGIHLEGVAPFELAVGWTFRACLHIGDVAAERVLFVVGEELAGDVFRRRLEADGTTLGVRGGGKCQQGKRGEHNQGARHHVPRQLQYDAAYLG